MIYSDFIKLYEELSVINESCLTESNVENIDLAKCRVITSDVRDIRGELEASSCLEYNGELTRVQVRTVIIRETENGREFLAKKFRHRTSLPGGGYDQEKDHGDITASAKREALEEFNFILTDVKDTGVRAWRHREDPWVEKHVENPEDRWTGYYSYFVVGKVSGNGNNENPEEINKWKWYPIKDLEKANKEVYNYVTSLDEAIHPDKPGRLDLGEVSYLCNSLEVLRKILSSMEIQKTYIPEVRYEIGEYNGNTCRIRQMSLSTSTNLVGHAERRPDKWGFGVILDGKVLSTYYDIEPYNHADHKLLDLKITKLVKLKPGVLGNSQVIISFGEYGNRIISNQDEADLRLYKGISQFINSNPEYLEKARTLDYYLNKKDKTQWKYHPFGKENMSKYDSRFTHITPDQVEEIYSYRPPYSSNSIPLKAIQQADSELFTLIQTVMKKYSSFEEEEERIWVANKLINFIQIPELALVGVILPDYFQEDFELPTPTNYHIAWIKDFVTNNNLRVEWHKFKDVASYKQALGQNVTDKSEASWVKIDSIISNPVTILNRAKLNNARLKKGLITKVEKEAQSPESLVATAAVKLAIKEYMQDLTYENFEHKYNTALNAAYAHFEDAGENGRTTKASQLFKEVFDYYCPDRPNVEN